MEHKKRAYLSASIGNILEFYDFALFGFYAKLFSSLFFPSEEPLNALLLFFSVFAIGFLCRPIGAVLFGYIGDRWGRKIGLSYSLMGIGAATLGMGLLPSYATWGIASPLILVFLRIIQGISVAGEYSGSLVFVAEYLKKYRAAYPAFVMGLVSAMGVLGWFSASLLALYFKDLEWGIFSWRIPFFFGSLVAGIGYFIRRKTQDAFEKPPAPSRSFVSDIKWVFSYPAAALKVFFIGSIMGLLFYGQFIFNNTFIAEITTLSPQTVKWAVMIGIFSYMILLPLMGALADRIGYKRALCFAALIPGLLGPVAFSLQYSGSLPALLATQLFSAAVLALLMSPGTFVMSLSFPFTIRCLGVSLFYNLGATLFGGITPNLYLLMYKKTGSTLPMACFFSFFCLLGAWVFYKTRFAYRVQGKPRRIEEFYFKFWGGWIPRSRTSTPLFSRQVSELSSLSNGAIIALAERSEDLYLKKQLLD